MPLRADDLPAHIRRQLEQQTGTRTRKRPSRAGTSDRIACAGRCGTCNTEFASYHHFEQHAKTTGHSIWSIDLPDPANDHPCSP